MPRIASSSFDGFEELLGRSFEGSHDLKRSNRRLLVGLPLSDTSSLIKSIASIASIHSHSKIHHGSLRPVLALTSQPSPTIEQAPAPCSASC
jgi:hypothetical protein